jgi:hypothetical protein
LSMRCLSKYPVRCCWTHRGSVLVSSIPSWRLALPEDEHARSEA